MRTGDPAPAPAGADAPSASGETRFANLLAGKLHPPRTRPGSVQRDRLLAELDPPGAGGTVTVVQAPAGWGKSSLLAAWAARQRARVAWFSIDETDNDPWRFWAHVAAGLDLVAPDIAAAPARLLRAPGSDLAGEVLPRLLGALAATAEPVALVLDDYHLIARPEIHAAVSLLVQHLPETCRVLVATRSEPALPLARLRAAGRVIDVGTDRLRFDEGEARTLLEDELSAALTSDEVHTLVERTEGWAAALHLAALSLRGRPDIAGAIEAFDGNDRHTVDYLVSEVLERQPAEVRSFLRRTSILERFSAALCDAVVGATGSGAVLDRIEREQLFLIRLDAPGRWYRYHHLFGEILRRELVHVEPERLPELHARASSWLAGQGHHAEAIAHAVEAGDTDVVCELLAAHYLTLMNDGHFGALERWFTEAVPEERLRADGRLALARSLLLSSTGRIDDAGKWLDLTDAAPPVTGRLAGDFPSVATAVLLLRSQLAYYGGDIGECLRWSHLGQASWREASPPGSFLTTYLIAACAVRQRRPEEALEVLTVDDDWARQTDNHLLSLYVRELQAMARLQLGDTDRAWQAAREAVTIADAHHLGEHWACAAHLMVLAWLELDAGDADRARQLAREAIEIGRRGPDRLCLADCFVVLARAEARAGDRPAATRAHEQARRLSATCDDPGVSLPDTFRSRRAVERGDLTGKQSEVLELLMEGLPNAEIARRLLVSERTVHAHLRTIYAKFGVSNRTAAVRVALERNLA